jgi:hypothetical protein
MLSSWWRVGVKQLFSAHFSVWAESSLLERRGIPISRDWLKIFLAKVPTEFQVGVKLTSLDHTGGIHELSIFFELHVLQVPELLLHALVDDVQTLEVKLWAVSVSIMDLTLEFFRILLLFLTVLLLSIQKRPTSTRG